MKNFWRKLKKPIFCLAPMADVTDYAFRKIITKYGKPDIFFTEFVSADGLCSAGKNKLLISLKYSKKERPIVAQIFGSKPENIRKASALCKKLGFDGIDINMGCPDKLIEKQFAGAALIKNPKLAREIIRAAKKGGQGLPLSVKTRIGYNKNEIETWIPELLKENLTAITIHLRTRKEMSNVPAHWDLVKRIIEIRNESKKKTLIIGNGDIIDIDDGRKKCKETGCDGVMIGRGVFGNPWFFSGCQRPSLTFSVSKTVFGDFGEIEEKLKVLIEHTKLFEKMLGKHKNFAIMKKHFKAYVNGFNGAKELCTKLMEVKNVREAESIINDFLLKI